MAIAKCTFCGKEQEDYKGLFYIKNDGSILYFSSSKCFKNHFKLRRDKRKIGWTEAFRLQREKRLAKDKDKKEKETKEVKEKAEEKEVSKIEKNTAKKV